MSLTRRSSQRRTLARPALGFEKFEDRMMMSGVPVVNAAAGPDPDAELESVANFQLRQARSFMTRTMEDVKIRFGANIPLKPLVMVYGGSLVVVGTDSVDNIQVEEHPARVDQKTRLQRPAEYVVTIRRAGATKDEVYSAIPLAAVPNRLVVIFGLRGNDTIKFVTANPTSTTKAYVDGGMGADTITGGPNGDFLDGGVADASIDKIYGGKGADIVAGGPGNDMLFGDADRDLMFGEAGNDTMRGGAGDDEMYGGDNDDTMFGDSENDFLFGGKGFDRLNGEAGADYLSGGQDGIADELVGGTQIDRFRFEGSKANNKDKPRKVEQGELIVANYADYRATAVGLNQSLAALDAGFDELGVRPAFRPARRVLR